MKHARVRDTNTSPFNVQPFETPARGSFWKFHVLLLIIILAAVFIVLILSVLL